MAVPGLAHRPYAEYPLTVRAAVFVNPSLINLLVSVGVTHHQCLYLLTLTCFVAEAPLSELTQTHHFRFTAAQGPCVKVEPVAALSVVLPSDDDDDEVMLNVLRCQLTY